MQYRLSVQGPEISQIFEVPIGTSTIGRQAGNHLVLEHSLVSRLHAQIERTPETCQLQDMGSSNGTKLNGNTLEPHTPVLLNHGDVVEIGPYVLTVEAVAIDKPREDIAARALKEQPDEAPMEEHIKGPPPPPPPKPPSPLPPAPEPVEEPFRIPLGLSTHSQRLIQYLPGIYHTDFMKRLLALFESILYPIEATVDNFDLFLDPGTAPMSFLPWLANWYEIIYHDAWDEGKRRQILHEAHQIFARRGTAWALSRALEIYLGVKPEISDTRKGLNPFTFVVTIPKKRQEINEELVQALINAHKPAHTGYKLEFKG